MKIDLAAWLGTIAAIAIWAFITAEDAWPAELRVQHTSRITGKVVERTIVVADCITAAALLRAQAIGRLRTWCNGRRI
jgi:hypothetical protein